MQTLKEKGKIYGLNLDDWQIKFIEQEGDKILCCGRQVGKSEICGIDAGEYAINNPKTKPIVMIAPTERQAFALFCKTLSYLAKVYPKKLITKGKDRPTKQKMKLTSGVEIYCLPVGKDGLGVRFLTIGRLYKDECSRIPDLVHEAVDPALLTTGGDEIDLSTPFGPQGQFYDTWKNRDKAYDSFTRFSISSEEVIETRPICETWTEKQREKAINKLAQAKARWSQRRYAQEFLGEFVEGLFRFFEADIIHERCILKRPETIPKDNNFIGIDLAHLGEDEGTIEVLHRSDSGKIYQIENIVTKKQKTTDSEENIIQTQKVFNPKYIGIDAGSGKLGCFIMERLIKNTNLRKLMVALDNKATHEVDYRGKTKIKVSKELMYENLRGLMEHGEIFLLDDDNLIESLKSVQYEYVMKDGEATKIRIFGNYTHIVEGLIRAAWLANQKSKNFRILYV